MNISPDCEYVSHCYLCGSRNSQVQSRISCHTGIYLQKSLCGDCGLLFSQIRPKWDYAVKLLYSHTEYLDTDAPLETRRVKRYQNIGAVLKQICPDSKTLLDVGSGTAVGTNEFQKMGWDVTGIEPDSRSALAAKTRHQNLEILPYTIEEYNSKSDKQFDLVTFIHSLEHIYDPQSVLSQIVKKVNAGGFLYIEVPNIANMGFFDYTHLAHVSYFSFNNLCRLMGEFGFSPYARLYPKSNPYGSYHLGVLFQKSDKALSPQLKTTPAEPHGLLRHFRLNLKPPYIFETDHIENILNDLRRCHVVTNGDTLLFDFKKSSVPVKSRKNLLRGMLILFLKDPVGVGSYVFRKVLVKLISKFSKDPDFETVKFKIC
ncbi:MAG: class I SAM-dependent methyltransferase [Bdellovibrionaceae bacterium]|nr:class I SAM-dependent methyltransferase [Pseudobdellovibrionaceae bacterium]